MTNYTVNRIKSFQILDKDTLETIADLDGIGNVTIESEIELNSLSKEVLEFNHSASFVGELTDCPSLLNYSTDFNNQPLYIEYYIPIMVQARWHKKKRINKKWLKRYGMKADKVLVRCDVDSISSDNSYDPYDPYDLTVPHGFNVELEFSNMQYKFRQDQLRRNLKIKMCYD